MKIVTVVGARPQFIKAAAVSRSVAQRDGVREVLIHTGQHYDAELSQVFFDELSIPRPDRNLGVGSGSHGAQTATMLAQLEEVLVEERPDWALVYGDTNSTLAGALAAAKLRVPLAHVEAGLRSFNRQMPEELNRVLTDHASDLLLAPTHTALANLRREGIDEKRIRLVGDVMLDATLFYLERAAGGSRIVDELGLTDQPLVVATVHRAENTDDPGRLEAILASLGALATRASVVLPLHPRTHEAAKAHSLTQMLEPLTVVPPVGYLDMLALLSRARLVATDSGGVQKEAFFVGTPCATLRTETEWTELVDAGWNHVLPPTAAELSRRLCDLLDEPRPKHRDLSMFGDGAAADAVVRALSEAAA